MAIKENYYQITVWIKGRAKPLKGVRKYLAHDNLDVRSLVNQSLLKYYYQDDILRIDINLLAARSKEIAEFLRDIEEKKSRNR